MLVFAWLCFIVATILLVIEIFRPTHPLTPIAFALIAFGLALTVWPSFA